MCVVFLEAENTSFSPACIKSHFLHTFIVVRTSLRMRKISQKYETQRYEVGFKNASQFWPKILVNSCYFLLALAPIGTGELLN